VFQGYQEYLWNLTEVLTRLRTESISLDFIEVCRHKYKIWPLMGYYWGFIVREHKKIMDYYENQGFLMTNLILRRPRHLTVAQIEAGAAQLYKKIQAGEVVKRINLGRRVYQEAEFANYEAYLRDQEILDHVKEIMYKIKKQRNF
jgi:hypothetical protein